MSRKPAENFRQFFFRTATVIDYMLMIVLFAGFGFMAYHLTKLVMI